MPRSPSLAALSTGPVRAAVRLVDITPRLGMPLAGYGPLSVRNARGWWGRLQALVIGVADSQGTPYAMVALELHAGTRWLHERLARSTGLGLERLFLMSSHTHQGPAGLYGDGFYDSATAHVAGFNKPLARWLHQRLQAAILATLADVDSDTRPCQVGVGEAPIWGWVWNRSIRSALGNLPPGPTDKARARAWVDQTFPGPIAQALPGTSEPDRRVIDGRMRALTVLRDGQPLAVIGLCGATPALMPGRARVYSGDAFAGARLRARRQLTDSWGGDVPMVLMASSMGDGNVVRADWPVDLLIQRRKSAHNPAEVQLRARDAGPAIDALADALHDAAVAGRGVATEPAQVRGHFYEAEIPSRRFQLGGQAHQLPDTPKVGASTLAGGEFNRSGIGQEHATRAHDPADPHSPKIIAATTLLQQILGTADVRELPDRCTASWLQLGDIAVCGLPSEPSTVLAANIEADLKQQHNLDHVLVAGLSGGFLGYASTLPEYMDQSYESASNFWGRAFGQYQHYVAQRAGLGSRLLPSPTLDTSGKAPTPKLPLSIGLLPPRAHLWFHTQIVNRGGRSWWRLRGRFPTANRKAAERFLRTHTLADLGPLFAFAKLAGGQYSVLEEKGLSLDDAQSQLLAVRTHTAGIRAIVWDLHLEVPLAAIPPGTAVTFAVSPKFQVLDADGQENEADWVTQGSWRFYAQPTVLSTTP